MVESYMQINDPSAWVEKAEEDYAIALLAIRRKRPFLYGACFHAQQTAEKYLKAALVSRKRSFPRVHDLIELSKQCSSAGIFLELDEDKLDSLSDYAIRVRYPGAPLDLKDAKRAIATAKLVRHFVRKLLGLK